jgi:hypothetical protein
MNRSVLSFDIGINNLSYCHLINNKINEWKCINIKDKNLENIILNAFNELDTINLDNINCILIENQPAIKNPKMKTIQISIYSYFLYKKNQYKSIEVILCSPSVKLQGFKKPINLTPSQKYKAYKQYSIDSCKSLIINDDKKWIDMFNSYKKQDDLADSYMQAVQHINGKSK